MTVKQKSEKLVFKAATGGSALVYNISKIKEFATKKIYFFKVSVIFEIISYAAPATSLLSFVQTVSKT